MRPTPLLRTLTVIALCLTPTTLTRAADPPAKPLPTPKPLPSNTPLPDPLTSADNHKLTASDWPARRTQLLNAFQDIEYGHLPPAPASVSVSELISHAVKPLNATHQQFKITCTLTPSSSSPLPPSPLPHLSFTLDLLTPKGNGPHPVILTGDACWSLVPPDIAAAILSRGYALAQFNRCEFAPDSAEQSKTGLHPAYPGADFGCLAAWAWGYQRAVDALLTLPQIDKSKIAITGHSRGGKCVLLAGALDDRVALVNPNASGCGGGGCFRDTPPDAETLKIITTKFPFWFKSDFQSKYADKERDLPFDQHELKACVAPRAYLETDGYNDVWSNPRGSFRTNQAAQPVFDLLNVPTHLAYHLRPGPHEHNMSDYTALLDFADELFFNKPSKHDWRPSAFPEQDGTPSQRSQ